MFKEINEQGDVFKQMFKHSVIPIIVHDLKMNIIGANDRAVEQFGYSHKQLLQISVFDLHPEEELVRSREVLGEMEQMERMSVETRFKRKDGSVFFAEATPCRFLLGGKPIIHVYIQDITERKKTEKELKRLNRQLAERNQALEEFTYATTHDLQEPLNTIIAWTSLLKDFNYENLNDRGKKSVIIIEKSAYRLKEFIISLLEYSRVNRPQEKNEIKVDKLIENIIIGLSDLIERENATVNYLGGPITLMAYNDLNKLLQNIITNGIKYRKKDVDPVITINAKELSDRYEFSVADNGIGIAKEYHEKVFEIFQRLHPREEYEGTGIGLSHCKKIVELHDGDIWVESEPGEGATFYFTILK